MSSRHLSRVLSPVISIRTPSPLAVRTVPFEEDAVGVVGVDGVEGPRLGFLAFLKSETWGGQEKKY